MSNIRPYREKHGLTLEAFGALVGVKKSAVSKWERGVQPSAVSAILIERVTDGEVRRSQLRPDLWSDDTSREGAAA